MEGEVDEAVWVAQVHLHPVRLCVQIYSHSLGHYLHLGVADLDSAPASVIIDRLVEEGRETFGEHLSNSDRGRFLVPALVGLRVLSDYRVSILVNRQSRQSLIQLDKSVMSVGEDTNGKPFEITNVLEKQLSGVLPERLIIVAEKPVFDHLGLILLHQELHNLVGIAHSQSL